MRHILFDLIYYYVCWLYSQALATFINGTQESRDLGRDFPKKSYKKQREALNNRRRRAKNNKKATSRRQGIVILIRSVACVYEKTKLLWMMKSELCIIMKFFRFPRWMLLVFTKLPTNLWVSYHKSNITHHTSHRLEKKDEFCNMDYHSGHYGRR